MDAMNPLCDPGFFEASMHQLEKDFNLVTLGLDGLSFHAAHEDDITTDQVDSICNYTCDLLTKLCNLEKAFPEMLVAASAKGRTDYDAFINEVTGRGRRAKGRTKGGVA